MASCVCRISCDELYRRRILQTWRRPHEVSSRSGGPPRPVTTASITLTAHPPIMTATSLFLPAATPHSPTTIDTSLRVLELETTRCAIGVSYHNTPKLIDCAAAPTGGLDGNLYQAALDARTHGTPNVYSCSGVKVPAGPYQVNQNSYERSVADALVTLGMTNYLVGDAVDWSKLTLAGHSHGGKVSQYVGTARHAVYGVATIEGSTNKMKINPTDDFLPWVYGPQMTPSNQQRAFQHVAGGRPYARRERMAARMGRSVQPPDRRHERPTQMPDERAQLSGLRHKYAVDQRVPRVRAGLGSAHGLRYADATVCTGRAGVPFDRDRSGGTTGRRPGIAQVPRCRHGHR